MFILEQPYLEAYALYFSKFIEAYRDEGIDIFAIMPQNEFNSAQIFPSCCWTAAGLAEFTGSYLGPAMDELGVDIYFGTMERPTEALVDTILRDEKSGPFIKGVGFQWAGKEALPGIHKRYPDRAMWQTEQECGDGRNDWRGAMYSWDLMKHYLNNGVSAYEYWNTSLPEGGISRWGWAQNSLVVVDAEKKDYRFSYEFYMMKHASHFVMPGAVKVETGGTYEDLLAFKNPDGSVVVVIANQEDEARTVEIRIGDVSIAPGLKANSMNTFRISG
jgi:glucosylceramidase